VTLDKIDALALRIHPYSETSQIVNWLTAKGEPLTTLVKGACRPKSGFLGQYDFFYTCELVFYRHDRPDGLHIAREIAPLKTRSRLRSDWQAFCGASYAGTLAAELARSGGAHARLYQQLEALFDALQVQSGVAALLIWFELQMLGLMGWAPQLNRCVVCGSAPPGDAWAGLAVTLGGVLCQPCRAARRVETDAVSAAGLALLRRWQTASSPNAALAAPCPPELLLVSRRVLGRFLLYHLDWMPRARRVAWQMTSGGKHAETKPEGFPR